MAPVDIKDTRMKPKHFTCQSCGKPSTHLNVVKTMRLKHMEEIKTCDKCTEELDTIEKATIRLWQTYTYHPARLI